MLNYVLHYRPSSLNINIRKGQSQIWLLQLPSPCFCFLLCLLLCPVSPQWKEFSRRVGSPNRKFRKTVKVMHLFRILHVTDHLTTFRISCIQDEVNGHAQRFTIFIIKDISTFSLIHKYILFWIPWERKKHYAVVKYICPYQMGNGA